MRLFSRIFSFTISSGFAAVCSVQFPAAVLRTPGRSAAVLCAQRWAERAGAASVFLCSPGQSAARHTIRCRSNAVTHVTLACEDENSRGDSS